MHDAAEWPTGVVPQSSARIPPGGTIRLPSKFSTEFVTDCACAPAWVARNATGMDEPPFSAEPNLTVSLFVRPVGVTFVMSLACAPPVTSVLRLSGVEPVEIAVFPTLEAHTKPPHPVACKAFWITERIACSTTTLIELVDGLN